jgi:hypothetical protein
MMRAAALRVYADTSVFGGCLDDEFAEESRAFFDEVRRGRFVLVISPTTLGELNDAPEDVQRILRDIPEANVETASGGQEVFDLRDAYVAAGVVGIGSKADAEHVAAASVAGVDMIVSWNFKHIVHFEKISGYNGVNLLKGYSAVRIFSPREVIEQ